MIILLFVKKILNCLFMFSVSWQIWYIIVLNNFEQLNFKFSIIIPFFLFCTVWVCWSNSKQWSLKLLGTVNIMFLCCLFICSETCSFSKMKHEKNQHSCPMSSRVSPVSACSVMGLKACATKSNVFLIVHGVSLSSLYLQSMCFVDHRFYDPYFGCCWPYNRDGPNGCCTSVQVTCTSGSTGQMELFSISDAIGAWAHKGTIERTGICGPSIGGNIGDEN